jgi:integrase
MHNDFTLFLRKYPNGQEVYFYYTYDEDGARRGPWTTGSVNKTEARNYCHKLMRKGALIPDRKKVLTFAEFAEGFWDSGSTYLENQESRKDVAKAYIASGKCLTKNQLIPAFGKFQLDKITTADVNRWLLDFTKKKTVVIYGKKRERQYKNSFANTAFRILTVIMNEAVRLEHIKINPCSTVLPLKSNRKNIEILNIAEVQKMFPDNYKAVWEDNFEAYAANKLASLTGMRAGEILGLRGDCVFDDHIYVCASYGQFGHGPTKTRATRNIPLLPKMIDILKKLKEKNGNGYLFSLDGGAKPMSRLYLSKCLYTAFDKIGIDGKEVKRRGLTLHSWRHFLNTDLHEQGLTLEQIQGVTGHKSVRMSEEVYNHFNAMNLPAVVKAQAIIDGSAEPDGDPDGGKEQEAKKGKKEKGNTGGLRLVKPAELKTA